MPLNPDDFRTKVSPELVDAYLRAAFDGPPAPVFAGILDGDLAAKKLLQFKFGPVLSLGEDRPARLTVSGVGEEEGWSSRLQGIWPDADIDGFLAQASPHSRKMVDWDGGKEALLYLDDLHSVPHDIAVESGDILMCATLHLETGEKGIITRHAAPPLERLPEEWRQEARKLADAGATGVWGVRWESGNVTGIVVVTETRSWHGIQPMVVLAGNLGGVTRISACNEVLAREGLMSYPDSIEVRPDGSYDLTLAVIEREA